MAGIKRKDSAEGRRGKVKRTKLEGLPAPKSSKKHAKKVPELDETDLAEDDTFSGFGDEDGSSESNLDKEGHTLTANSTTETTISRPAVGATNNCMYIH